MLRSLSLNTDKINSTDQVIKEKEKEKEELYINLKDNLSLNHSQTQKVINRLETLKTEIDSLKSNKRAYERKGLRLKEDLEYLIKTENIK